MALSTWKKTSPVCPAPNPLLLSWVAHLLPSQQAGNTWPSHRDPEVHSRMMYWVCVHCVSLWSSLRNLQAVCHSGFTISHPHQQHVPFFPPPQFLSLTIKTGQLLPSSTSGSCQPLSGLVSFWPPAKVHSGQHRKARRRRHKGLAAPHRRLLPEMSCPRLTRDIRGHVFGISIGTLR